MARTLAAVLSAVRDRVGDTPDGALAGQLPLWAAAHAGQPLLRLELLVQLDALDAALARPAAPDVTARRTRLRAQTLAALGRQGAGAVGGVFPAPHPPAGWTLDANAPRYRGDPYER